MSCKCCKARHDDWERAGREVDNALAILRINRAIRLGEAEKQRAARAAEAQRGSDLQRLLATILAWHGALEQHSMPPAFWSYQNHRGNIASQLADIADDE